MEEKDLDDNVMGEEADMNFHNPVESVLNSRVPRQKHIG